MRSLMVRAAVVAGVLVTGLASPASGEVQSIESACPSNWRVSFTDVSDDNVHAAAVECVAAWAIAKGTSEDEYSPRLDVTRAQMATFIARTIVTSGGSLDPNAPDAFDDDDESPHQVSINALAEVGIVGGVRDRTYGPGADVTRAQMATFLVRALEYRMDASLDPGGDAFADDDGNQHEGAIDKAYEAGLVGGNAAGDYNPGGTVQRDAMGSFIARTLGKLVTDGYMDPPPEGEPPPSGQDPDVPPPEPEDSSASAMARTTEAPSGDGTVWANAISWYHDGAFQCQGVTTPVAYAPNVWSSGHVAWIPEYIWYLPSGGTVSEWGQWLWSYQGSQWQYFSQDAFYPPDAYTGHLAVRNWVYDYTTGQWWTSWSTTTADINGHGGGQYYCYFNAWGLPGAGV